MEQAIDIGAILLDQAKYYVFQFHYRVLKDYLIAAFYTLTLFPSWAKFVENFGTISCLPATHCANTLIFPITRKIIACLVPKTRRSLSKSKLNSVVYALLKPLVQPKLYSIMTHERQKYLAKSVTKFAQSELTHKDIAYCSVFPCNQH